MREETFERVVEELRRARRTLRAFEDASRAERTRQHERILTVRGAELAAAIATCDELRGKITGLVEAGEIVAEQLAAVQRQYRTERLSRVERPT